MQDRLFGFIETAFLFLALGFALGYVVGVGKGIISVAFNVLERDVFDELRRSAEKGEHGVDKRNRN